jgi:exopolyphosphatase/guanosine-5'-triphosphate,3'-diphosphate pyrophosphatase
MKIRKYAAIDIGSNAIRLLIQNVIEAPDRPVRFNKSSLIRVPVRLGEDSFRTGRITPNNELRIEKTLRAFGLLMEVSGVERYRACATSALREAENGPAILDRIRRDTGMPVELIDGREEAQIIASTDLRRFLQEGITYLNVDVGGGSTEFTWFIRGVPAQSLSFRIGTVRLLDQMVTEAEWAELEAWLRQESAAFPQVALIGSGGNINKLHKMSGRKREQPLSYAWLQKQYRFLEGLSYDQRVAEIGLNPDRADVILPAARIFLAAARWSGARRIYVPQIGLADGIIRHMYYNGVLPSEP